MTQPGMLIVDVQRCIACKRCAVYCAVAHSESKELETAVAENAPPEARVVVKELGDFSAPYQCRHCEEPPCAEACPTDSLAKGEDVRVELDLDSCTGQAKCVRRCPFLGIWMNREGSQAVKCDLCIGRLAEGGIPACAEACPTDALVYKPFDELTDEERAWRSGQPGAALVRRTGIRYVVDPEECIGCTRCAKVCPVEAAVGERKQPHRILQDKCITCGGCYLSCPVDAIVAVAPSELEETEAAMAAKAPEPDAPEAPPAEKPEEPDAPAAAQEGEKPEAPKAPEAPRQQEQQQPSGPSKKELRRRERKKKRKAKKAKKAKSKKDST
ncbi:MAG: 4Fe-4S dicluster domain-containing protein [Planctomycetota bacterium]